MELIFLILFCLYANYMDYMHHTEVGLRQRSSSLFRNNLVITGSPRAILTLGGLDE